MRRFCLCAVALLFCLWCSCARSKDKEGAPAAQSAPPESVSSLMPLAVLQAGEFPLWFQFTGEGPVLIETIEDACFSAALVPWTLAPHVRFMLARGGDVVMAVNRDGFICFSPRAGGHTAVFRFSGGDFWRQYTVGAFALLGEKPAALLYRDDRFLDSNAPLPSPRLWTFDLQSTQPQSLAMPALDAFAPEDGWDIDALRRGSDGAWYFRSVKKTAAQPEIRMLRSDDLVREGEQVSLGAFQNAALPEPLSAAPEPLREMLAAVFAGSDYGLATIVSPEFQTVRSFAADREKAALAGFFSGGQTRRFFLAVSPHGDALYVEADLAVRRFSLPPLPEGFIYTGIGMCGDTIIASWEEQDEYSTGAAGFMAIKHERS